MLATSTVIKAQVINNEGDEDLVYTRLVDDHGAVTSNLSVRHGKAYIRNGSVDFGTGVHTVTNVDGEGQYISLIPSLLVSVSAKIKWVLGFRVHKMEVSWTLDETRGKQVCIDVHSLQEHSNVVSYIVGDRQDVNTAKCRIRVQNKRVILSGVPNLPLAPARVYLSDAVPTPVVNPNHNQSATRKDADLLVRKDGTIANQDVLVNLTSPITGEPETVVSDKTLLNDYMDQLLLAEITGLAGQRIGLLWGDRGATLQFDAVGVPVYGSGKLKVEAVQKEGLLVSGWLATDGKHTGKRIKSADIEFMYQPPGSSRAILSRVVFADGGDTKPKPKM